MLRPMQTNTKTSNKQQYNNTGKILLTRFTYVWFSLTLATEYQPFSISFVSETDGVASWFTEQKMWNAKKNIKFNHLHLRLFHGCQAVAAAVSATSISSYISRENKIENHHHPYPCHRIELKCVRVNSTTWMLKHFVLIGWFCQDSHTLTSNLTSYCEQLPLMNIIN